MLLILIALALTSSGQRVTTLSYSDAVPDGGVALQEGHAVAFTAPADNWTLIKVAVCGRINPGNGSLLVLEIWDTDLRTLYRSTDLAGYYFGQDFSWREIAIPELVVPRNFLICLFEFSGVYLGADHENQSAGRSMIAARSPNRILPWQLGLHQNHTEWMIAAVGYSRTPPPEVSLTARAEGEGLALQAQASDPDGNLAGAFFYVISSKGEAVWSEERALMGAKADAELHWSGQAFNVSNQSLSTGPVYAKNTLNMSAAEAPYSSYSAPAILYIAPGAVGISISAFFGKGGDLNALVDDAGNFYYLSRDLLGLLQPALSYGKYVENNLSLKEFQSSLSFFKFNRTLGLVGLQPLVLTRSPLQHFGIMLEKGDAPAGDYMGMVRVFDSEGNMDEGTATP